MHVNTFVSERVLHWIVSRHPRLHCADPSRLVVVCLWFASALSPLLMLFALPMLRTRQRSYQYSSFACHFQGCSCVHVALSRLNVAFSRLNLCSLSAMFGQSTIARMKCTPPAANKLVLTICRSRFNSPRFALYDDLIVCCRQVHTKRRRHTISGFTMKVSRAARSALLLPLPF